MAAVGDDRAPVGGEGGGESCGPPPPSVIGRSGGVGVGGTPRKQPQPGPDLDLEAGEGVVGDVGPRGQPVGQARAIGTGEPQGGGDVARQIGEQGGPR